ncbi:MAG: metalloprotease [Candidatus Altiarchaeales archaeon ex4484_96]|nr:MAG: metalloprotease [Candidatus Altiarchaeales archaeon ex4484_96]
MKQKKFSISPREIWELLTAWVILSIAFAILYSQKELSIFLIAFPISMVAVGLGFALHELGHKYLAQKYGLSAYFKANYQGLFLAVLFSFAGFILVSPGAVHIYGGQMSEEQHGRIALYGPLMNLLLALGFLLLYLTPLSSIALVSVTAWLGYSINTWIGLFNLIPTHPFDGADIKKWSMPVYLAMVFLMGALFILSYLI